jgi:hypothetical protein
MLDERHSSDEASHEESTDSFTQCFCKRADFSLRAKTRYKLCVITKSVLDFGVACGAGRLRPPRRRGVLICENRLSASRPCIFTSCKMGG